MVVVSDILCVERVCVVVKRVCMRLIRGCMAVCLITCRTEACVSRLVNSDASTYGH